MKVNEDNEDTTPLNNHDLQDDFESMYPYIDINNIKNDDLQ